jgi:hypothetical protein
MSCDYFVKQHKRVDVRNFEVLCFLCGTDCIFSMLQHKSNSEVKYLTRHKIMCSISMKLNV